MGRNKRDAPTPTEAVAPIITISTADLSPWEPESPVANEPLPDDGLHADTLRPATSPHSLVLPSSGSNGSSSAGRPRVTSVTSLSDGETMVATSSSCGSYRTRSVSEVTAVSVASNYQQQQIPTVYNFPHGDSDSFGISPDALDTIFDRKCLEDIWSVGGLSGLAFALHSHCALGIKSDERTMSTQTLDASGRRSHADRVKIFGSNRLPEKKTKVFWRFMWEALQDRVLILLTVVATISLVLGLYQTFCQPHKPGQPKVEWVEGTTIMAAVIVVVVVSSLNDYKKETQFAKLSRKKEDRTVTAIRSGMACELSAFDVVVGEIVQLEAGDLIPADGILVSGYNVRCDESSMTGESHSIKKTAGDDIVQRKKQGIPAGNLDPFIVSGCKVVEGVGTYIVTRVGERSTYGKTMMSLVIENAQTPLQQRLGVIADQIAVAGITVAALLFAVLTIKFFIELPGNTDSASEKGQLFLRIVIVCIAVVVIAVPEGLPLAVTLALAIAVTKMLKDNNLVRILSSCETMGGVTTVCCDKTGTLTTNQMAVVSGTVGMQYAFESDENTQAPKPFMTLSTENLVLRLSEQVKFILAQSIVINSTTVESEKHTFIGSRTEMALLSFAREHLGIRTIAEERANAEVVQMIPFDSNRKCMASVVNLGGIYRMYVKGAPEVLLDSSTQIVIDASDEIMNTEPISEHYDQVIDSTRNYSNRSLRMIGFAYRDFSSTWPPFDANTVEGDPTQAIFEDVMQDMTFIGLVGIQDPLRPGVNTAILNCRKAGVSVKMVTGDNIDTAKAIAVQAGILDADGVSMDGPTFRELSKSDLYDVLPRLQVLARSSPEDKQVLVKALKELGEVVAVTGDGTNDAPALTAADVGFSMGVSGTDIALEASSIILMDDNFSSIVKAIEWGRTVNDAIKKFLQFQLTVNVTAVALTFVSAITSDHDESILTPVQLLWINLIMDTFAAMALATDPPPPDILDRRPEEKSASMITLTMWKMIVVQSIYQLSVTLALNFSGNRILGYTGTKQESLETVVFNTFVWMQFFNQYNNRRLDNKLNVFEGIHNNWYFLGINLITIVGQLLIISFGGSALSAVRLDGIQWAISLSLGAFSLIIGVLARLVPDDWIRSALYLDRWQGLSSSRGIKHPENLPDEFTPLLDNSSCESGSIPPNQTGFQPRNNWSFYFFGASRPHVDIEAA
ncbi:putative calcium p-type ATPase NCA-3 [Talaromyces proteolyticus]|uniref:Calcium-transporting ATPase n=1 Tax=Talaromyces proteolyticus TaxID=1131652 RepID=A0AAD4KXR1_9EURO|nr:putative calcium p-type ATPase NCA-3 [Talaromyces proteolyticus]KAH8699198.1 putative calcium p-type ATPase NCA-3 [Talaromyces proteolyticus]